MTKVIHTENAPAAIGPYVQAVDLGNLVFTSGQIPVNPKTGEVSADITEQARQALENVTTVFVKDLNDLATVNAEYEKFFRENNHPAFPTRSCVEVARLPKDVGLEIEAIAVRP